MAKFFDLFSKKKHQQSTEWGQISERILTYKRTAWIPRVMERSSSPLSAKFSGEPALQIAEDWPKCNNCQQPMQMFLQLNSANLPAGAGKPFGDGLLQVFYCTNWEQECEVDCEAYNPFAKSTLVRVLGFNVATRDAIMDSPVMDPFPEKEIIGWDAKDDYPNWEELDALGCSLTNEQFELLAEDYPLPKDKLLGWPYWVQAVEYPQCPECGDRMAYIFQIDSEDNLPYMFGDSGCAHVTQCKQHQHVLTIAWASC